jgi:DNA repair protein RadA/Sms
MSELRAMLVAMPKLARSRFVCQACGHVEGRWLGRCPECNVWSALVEEIAQETAPSSARQGLGSEGPALRLREIDAEAAPRVPTGLRELDRVLGGGLVPGSLVLLGGDPGVGKSTLLLQALDRLARGAERPVLYVSGEESARQVALRGERLGAGTDHLFILAETRLERILAEATRLKPRVLAVDSVQTLQAAELQSIPGSVGQVREAAARLLAFAKTQAVPTLLVGHVTKDGGLAGPKTLEHVVDTVLSFEGEPGHPYRILRASKNRFGSTQEIGVFEMRGAGLEEVANPSEAFLAERPVGVAGSVVAASAEGTRPILVELQALVAPPSGVPRRTALGVDGNRVALLLAVVERQTGLELAARDVFVNVAGGVRLGEPAIDLGVACAIASSARGRPVAADTVVFGEIGLAGEVRAVPLAEVRLAEAAKLGFARCVLPEVNRGRLPGRPPLELVGVRDLRGALRACWKEEPGGT